VLYNQFIKSIGLLFLSSTLYCMQVPADRIGYKVMSAAQLRVIAEFFALVSFVFFFSINDLNEKVKNESNFKKIFL